jgi:phospholipase C
MRTAGVSYYFYMTIGAHSQWNSWLAPILINKLCKPNSTHTACTDSRWLSTVQQTAGTSKLFNDIANGTLPQVSFVMPTAADSDHPLSNNGTGPSWVASVVNAIGTSHYWDSTLIVITWDDAGGFYDHVAPPTRNQFEYGFRVPFIVVSPYAKVGYVSHVMLDFGSIQGVIEKIFHLPSLRSVDSVAGDLTDTLDLDQVPRKFKLIPAPLNKTYFLHMIIKDEPIDDD